MSTVETFSSEDIKNTLIHARLALDASNNLLAAEVGDDGLLHSWRIDNRRTVAEIDRALRSLGVDPSLPLPVRAIGKVSA
jgi:hypothetical protein